jgi:hypothetical protein
MMDAAIEKGSYGKGVEPDKPSTTEAGDLA